VGAGGLFDRLDQLIQAELYGRIKTIQREETAAGAARRHWLKVVEVEK
jgi:hypothetical protein